MSSFAGSLIISVLILTIGYAVSSILRKDTLYPLIAIAGVFLYISALTVMYITGIISSEFFRTQSQVFRVIGIVLISLSGPPRWRDCPACSARGCPRKC